MSKCYQKDSKNFKQIEKSIDLLKAVTEPNRLRILCILSKMNLCVCDLAKRLDASHNLISHHLKTLYEVGVLDKRRNRNKSFYFIKEEWKSRIKHLFDFVKIK